MKKNVAKRVELHCHSNYSWLDGVASPGEILSFADRCGMPAVAITDHGVLSAFPEMNEEYQSGKFSARPIYGTEAYVVNDLEPVIRNYHGQDFDSEFVIEDIEVTGISSCKDKIISIDAIRIIKGEIVEHFHTLVNPNESISSYIAELTGINDDMVIDAPGIETAYPMFEEFLGDAVLVGHNLSFDSRFLKAAARNLGREFNPTALDTVPLSRYLFPDIESYKLSSLCKCFNFEYTENNEPKSIFKLLFKCLLEMKKRNLHLSDINETIKADTGYIKACPCYHTSILVKNEQGKGNLLKLISESFDRYYCRRPRIPLSSLLMHHDGLLIGSGCSGGLLFSKLIDGCDEDELSEVASVYDYIEVQPITNNLHLLAYEYFQMNHLDEIAELTKRLVYLGEKLGIPVVATSDVHYLKSSEREIRNEIYSLQDSDIKESEQHFYFRSTQEMLRHFRFLPRKKAYEIVVENSIRIAEQCQPISIEPDTPEYQYTALMTLLEASHICQNTGISKKDMYSAIMKGKIIEQNSYQYDFNSCLICGKLDNGQVIHVLLNTEIKAGKIIWISFISDDI